MRWLALRAQEHLTSFVLASARKYNRAQGNIRNRAIATAMRRSDHD